MSAGSAGSRFRKQVEQAFEGFEPPDDALLTRVCALMDRIQRLEGRLVADGDLLTGSTGQMVAHPLLAELRHCELSLPRLLKDLALGADDETESPRTAGARKAANARWGRR